MAKYRTFLTALAVVFAGAAASQAHVDLTYPTGGETFNAGDVVDIQWAIVIDHGDCDWDLYFSSDNGATWTTIAENIVKTQLHYNWTVPSVPTTQAVVRVVQDNVSAPNYDSWSGAMTVLAPEPIPAGSVWTWGILAAILTIAASLALRRTKVPARAGIERD